MHKFSMPEEVIARVVARVGRTHPFDKLEASKTAFVVIDMQNYYLNRATWVTCHWHMASSLRRRWLRSGTTKALLCGSRIAITDVLSLHLVKADIAVASVKI
jgi:hypothetical protein